MTHKVKFLGDGKETFFATLHAWASAAVHGRGDALCSPSYLVLTGSIRLALSFANKVLNGRPPSPYRMESRLKVDVRTN
jgi:hypothetical protein